MVQTPQMRCAQIQASRGSRPCEDQLDPAKHGPGAPGVRDLSAVHLSFDPKVAFNAGDRIDYQACHAYASLPCFGRRAAAAWARA